MKKINRLNANKIIIFTLLLIGIILISPIINSRVYAKSGNLPAKLKYGKLQVIEDAVSEALFNAEKVYSETKMYKENDKFLKNKTKVNPHLKIGDEFWTAKGSLLQQFDDNYQNPSEVPKGPGGGKITANAPNLSKYVFTDLQSDIDIYCANRGVQMFQSNEVVTLEGNFGMPGSKLAARLNYFIRYRDGLLAGSTSIGTVPQDISSRVLDAYPGAAYSSSAISKADMLDRFGYDYPASSATYPYTIKTKLKDSPAPGGGTYDDFIVKLNGNTQYSDKAMGVVALIKNMSNTRNLINTEIFAESVAAAIEQELGSFKYSPVPGDPTGVADTVPRGRTNSYYQASTQNRKLTPAGGFIVAATHELYPGKSKSGSGYPGLEQVLLWHLNKDGIQFGENAPSQHDLKGFPESADMLDLAAAFETHYYNLENWRGNTKVEQYNPGFRDVLDSENKKIERNLIFNAKSDKYKEGAWLVGPYKMDYLLSVVPRGEDEHLYFSGLEKMELYGEYTNPNSSIKPIKQWSYFVPLSSSGKGLTAAEVAKGIKTSKLKYGVPEPNQEFYIEIPYDENLLRVAKLHAYFNAISYEAFANYYIGVGEYIDFDAEFAVEKADKIAEKYKDVSQPSISIDHPGTSKGKHDEFTVTVVLDKKPYLTNEGTTLPTDTDEDEVDGGQVKWKREGATTVKAKITPGIPGSGGGIYDGFFYDYTVKNENGVSGGLYTQASFSKRASVNINTPNLTLTYETWENKDIGRIYIRTNYLTSPWGNGDWATLHWYDRPQYTENSFSVNLHTLNGQQTGSINIRGLGPKPKPEDPGPGDGSGGNNGGGSNGGVIKEPERPIPPQMSIPKVDVYTNIAQGRTNKFNSINSFRGVTQTFQDGVYGNSLLDGYTYVLHKMPDVLIVPKTAVARRPSQPQMNVYGRLVEIKREDELGEDIPTTPPASDEPAFLLPIGGKVWEDRPIGDKLAGYDFILKNSTDDQMMENITVRVNRVIINTGSETIVEKQEARVFAKGNYNKPIGRDDIKTDKNGVWGKYYLRDLGFTRDEITKKGYSNKTHLVKFEVEFEYDGIAYMPVPPLASFNPKYAASSLTLKNEELIANNSTAVENIRERDEFNQFIGEINGKTALQPAGGDKSTTVGSAIGISSKEAPHLNSEGDTDLLYEGEYSNQIKRTVSELKTEKEMRASTLNTGLLYPIGDVYAIDAKQAMSTHSASSETNGAFDLVIVMDNSMIGEFQGKTGVTIEDAGDNKSVVIFHEANTHMENINLGLMERRKVDLKLESDLMLTIQFVNKKALINNYGKALEIKDGELINKTSGSPTDLQYKLDVYKADYIYRTAMYEDTELAEFLEEEARRLKEDGNNDTSGRELDIYLQYKQIITNESQVDQAVVTGLDTYYDKSVLEPVLEKVIKETDEEEIESGKVTGRAAIVGKNVVINTPEYRIVDFLTKPYREFEDVREDNLYGKSGHSDSQISLHGDYTWEESAEEPEGLGKLTSLHTKQDGAKDDYYGILLPSRRRLEVVTNFKVLNTDVFKGKGIDNLENSIQLGKKHHLTEISGYATYNKYTGKVSGKVDLNSAPANVNLKEIKFTKADFDNDVLPDYKFLEDDTGVAPIIELNLVEEAPREVSGRVWEEKRNTQVARVNMGDGKFSSADGELGIPDKVIALEERISIRGIDLSEKYRMDNLLDNKAIENTDYYVDFPHIWHEKIDKSGIKISSLKDATGFQSYIRTASAGEYKFSGVPAGNFVAQLPYIIQGNEITKELDIKLDDGQIETTKIVLADERDKSPQVYNGQDFKVSIYDAGNIDTVNQTWMPIEPTENHSYARDSEFQRFAIYKNSEVINGRKGDSLEVLNLGHDEIEKDPDVKEYIISTANMVAETPLMNLGLDYYNNVETENLLYKKFEGIFALPGITVENGKESNKIEKTRGYSNVNIALEERPKTKLVLDKQISELILSNSDGTPIVEAKYTTTYNDDHVVMPTKDKAILENEIAGGPSTYDKEIKTGYTYSTPEYVLKVKTEVDKDSLNGDRVTPLNTMIYSTQTPYWETNEPGKELYSNARGWENIEINPPYERTSNGYIHLNFDKQLLSDTNIEIKYQIQLYNLGEVDRATIQEDFKDQNLEDARIIERNAKLVGRIAKGDNETYSKLNHEIKPDKYGFGRFFGRGYYTGKYSPEKTESNHIIYQEDVAKTSALKIIDYIDNSAVKDDLQGDDWVQILSPEELKDAVAAYDASGNKTFDLSTENMSDPDDKSYFKTGGSNIYVNEKMNKGLVPFYEYITAVKRGVNASTAEQYNISSTIATKRLSSEQADEDLSFDNIVEIIEYTTDTGRRSPSSTPGNINTRDSDTFKGYNLEPDTGLALLVTITPPTGLSKAQRTAISTVNITLAAMAVIAVGAVIAKVAINNKTKNTDDISA